MIIDLFKHRVEEPMSQASSPNWQPTACILCECNCGIEVKLGGDDGRQLLSFRGDKKHPASQGYACEKPHRLNSYQHGRDRLTKPLRRNASGQLEEIDWDTAIKEVAERLARVRDEHGGETIFYYGGGGQGNHLPGAYSVATRRTLGSRYRSSALAQEKTGEFWISQRMLGAYTRGDFEHCQVGLFLGKNPWYSHSIPRARVTLKALSRDPARTLIVIDPRRTKTAELADIHLQVKPGRDAYLLSALIALLFQESQLDQEFLNEYADGLAEVQAAFQNIPIAEYCQHSGIPESQLREVAKVIGQAESFASFEDLGVQMNKHSTLVSYLHRLVWLLTGNFGKQGSQYIPTPLFAIADGRHKRNSPVAEARIIGGLVPCNVIAEEILSDHPKRYRAMIVEAANPAHSLADSQRMREALKVLDTLVVIDVALSETAQLADYVLPASTQFEKAEATFFNLEFPKNYFHLRPALFPPPSSDGPLPEAEIHARLVEALGVVDDDLVKDLSKAAETSREAFTQAFMEKVAMHPINRWLAPVLLYRCLGPTLPEPLKEGAVLWALAFQAAFTSPQSLARAGFEGPPPVVANALFDALLNSPSGLVFAVDQWSELRSRIGTKNGRVQLALEDMLEAMKGLTVESDEDADFPFVLAAGERRAFTANTIIRDPHWRRKDQQGLLRIHPKDAEALGVETGGLLKLTTRRGSLTVSVELSDSMQVGHISLPNGMGLTHREDADEGFLGGVAPNELTASEDRDPFVGTPHHKHVRAALQRP